LSTLSHDPTIKASLWRPLRIPVFRNLLAANVVNDIGAFMQVVGAAWSMLSLKAGPMYVALIQTASALPYVLLALPAGALGRRRRSPQAYLVYRNVDAKRCSNPHHRHDRGANHSVVAPASDIRFVGRGRIRDTNMARGAAGTGH
jgi:hypothetical protein